MSLAAEAGNERSSYRVVAGRGARTATPDDDDASPFARALTRYGGGCGRWSATAWSTSRTIEIRGSIARTRLAAELDHAGSSRHGWGCCGTRDGVIDRRRGRMVWRPGGSYRGGRGDHYAGHVDLAGATAPEVLVSGGFISYSSSQPRRNPHFLAQPAPIPRCPRLKRGSGRAFRMGRCECASCRGRTGRVGVPAGMVAQWGSLFRIGPSFGLVESLSRARRRDRAHGGDGRRVRATAMAVWHVDLRVQVRGSPDLMLRPRRRLEAGRDRYGSKRLDVIPTEFTDIAQLRAAPGRVVFIGGSPSEAPRSSTLI